MTTAIIGIGNIGGTVARDLASGGEAVVLSANRRDEAQKLAAEIGPGATAAGSNRDAVQQADTIVLALWLGPMRTVIEEVADLLPGKLVVDTSNPISFGADGTVSEHFPKGSPPVRSSQAGSRQERGSPRRSGRWQRRSSRRARIERRIRRPSSTPPMTTGRRPRSSV